MMWPLRRPMCGAGSSVPCSSVRIPYSFTTLYAYLIAPAWALHSVHAAYTLDGVVSGDPHSHASPSGDASITMEQRLLATAAHGIDVPVRLAASSPLVIDYPHTYLNAADPGRMLYGIDRGDRRRLDEPAPGQRGAGHEHERFEKEHAAIGGAGVAHRPPRKVGGSGAK